MKKLVLLLVMGFLVEFSYSQPKIQFEQTTHDFGSIKEEGGKQSHKFEFTNVGDSALMLTKVKPGCGCTATDHTKTAIMPGERGYVIATYDPMNRPGAFHKSITVTTNEPAGNSHIIFIKGTVIKRPPTPKEQAGFMNCRGDLCIKVSSKDFEIKNTETRVDTFILHNFGNKTITVDYERKPAWFTEESRSFGQAIDPGKEERLLIKYNAKQRGAFGTINDYLLLKTNDSIEPSKGLYYNIKIREDFSQLTPIQKKNAPQIVIDSLSVNFGTIKTKETKTKDITLTNTGKNPLLIRNIKPNTSMVKPNMETLTIPAGQSQTVTLTFKAYDRPMKQNGTIEIISNDPNHDVIVLNYSATVVQ
ncbi:MAG: DUF1573 domain-containing protein [Bacteroidales bacterium]|jgi:hypothetical protein|nr:DUF1573 domain-containing protein [Bacteroidales bacterium]